MNDIRHYIDLVEDMSAPFDDSRALQKEIERCKGFDNAEAYATSHYNPVRLTHADDDESSVPRRLWNKEAVRMKDRWNQLQRSGMLGDASPPPSRFGRR